MKNRILLVAPYSTLHHLSEKLVTKLAKPIDVITGNLKTIPAIMEEIAKRKPEVVISRGGTYQTISRLCTAPVVELKISAYDILRACEGIHRTKGPIGFLGFVNVVYGMETIERILNRKIHSINLGPETSPESVRRHVRKLAEKGVRYFVGDAISHNTAREMGYEGGMVETDEKTISLAIDEAMHLLEVKLKERMVAERYKVIVDSTDGGIVSSDSLTGNHLLNKAAKVFCQSQNITPDQLIEAIDMTVASPPGGTELMKVTDDCTLTVHKTPVELDGSPFGVVATFRTVSQIQNIEEKIRTELSAKGLEAKYTFDDILHESGVMERIVVKARKYAQSDSTVLIQAATGTGKELFAQSIHNASLRSGKPFVAINCAALPESLLESELFGHVEGAFTGAKRGGRTGLFELAHGGSIFLDEIGDMPLNLQARLLRVIQEKEVMRVGGEKIIPVDVRVIASTNVDLLKSVEVGNFREDLYYRLNILSLRIPTLNERPQDILLLASKLMRDAADRNGKTILGMDRNASTALLRHDYRGNIRELRGIIERAVVIADTPYLIREDLGLEEASPEIADKGRLASMERDLLTNTLKECGNNYSRAAQILGIDRSTLYRKLGSKSDGRQS